MRYNQDYRFPQLTKTKIYSSVLIYLFRLKHSLVKRSLATNGK